mmetsp:Transcript_28033/g.68135  ORF Transcript_28033/g.68135 Transcript_28033/m.68135 type:complete len:439 (-) Transcript_28033:172-1488(-)
MGNASAGIPVIQTKRRKPCFRDLSGECSDDSWAEMNRSVGIPVIKTGARKRLWHRPYLDVKREYKGRVPVIPEEPGSPLNDWRDSGEDLKHGGVEQSQRSQNNDTQEFDIESDENDDGEFQCSLFGTPTKRRMLHGASRSSSSSSSRNSSSSSSNSSSRNSSRISSQNTSQGSSASNNTRASGFQVATPNMDACRSGVTPRADGALGDSVGDSGSGIPNCPDRTSPMSSIRLGAHQSSSSSTSPDTARFFNVGDPPEFQRQTPLDEKKTFVADSRVLRRGQRQHPHDSRDFRRSEATRNQVSNLDGRLESAPGKTRLAKWLNGLGMKRINHLDDLQCIVSLDLSNMGLQHVPMDICHLHALEHLNLSNNRIMALPREIGRLWNLKTLNLSNNPIQRLPDEIGRLTKLTRLDVRQTDIEEIRARNIPVAAGESFWVAYV